MRIIFPILGCLLLLLHSPILYAFDGPITRQLGIEQGLSNNSVRCIYQDHNGFMWFGTYDGLNRYDGYQFQVFRNKLNDTTSLPHNYIYSIHEDARHNLWVGTGRGLGIYNNLTARFLPAWYLRADNHQKARITVNVSNIASDAAGNVYIGTNGYGLMVRPKGKEVAEQLLINKGGTITFDYNVQAIRVDRHQRIWLFIARVGLCRYDPARKQIRVVNNRLQGAQCMADDGESLWIGTNSGLFQYSIPADSLVRSYKEGPGELSSANVASLCPDRQGQLWIGTEAGGINVLDPRTGRFSYLLPGETSNSLSSESVFSIVEDKEGRKWMGTLKGGINIIDAQKPPFRTISHDPLNTNSLINNFVSSFYEDAQGNLYIGTDGGGMSIWNRKENTFSNFRHQGGNPASLSHNMVDCIRQDYLGNIWIATYGGGINRFQPSSRSFRNYRCVDGATGEENKNVWLVYEDRDKVLWATTFIQGRLYRFNREADRFETFDAELNDLIALTEDRSGQLWGGNSYQLILIDKQTKKHRYFSTEKPVRALHEDRKGNFWVGTEGGGLLLFDRRQGKIVRRFSADDGLCNNSVLNILEDGRGHLWLSTFNGLSEFDPVARTFKNYYQYDGLQSNQFLYNAALRLRSGELAFGGIRGFNLFFPERVQARSNQPPVLLTGLRINNQPVTTGTPYITATEGDRIEAVRIPFSQAVLSFDVAALEYSAPGRIRYAYFLEGWDKGWNYSGSLRTANYTHLREGAYVLHVKATTAAGSWNPRELRLKITVLPPWYRSWWAYTLYLLLVAGAISLYQRYRIRQARLRYEVRIARLNAENERTEKEKSLAELELEKAERERGAAELAREKAEKEKERAEREKAQAEYEKTQAQYQAEKAERETEKVINEREKEINEKRLSFFTHISHEFRTPLTLIINPVKDLLQKGEGRAQGDQAGLNTVYRNARRLISLVDQLLLFRKAEAGADKLKITRLNFSALCREVYLAFAQQARVLEIDYRFDGPEEPLELYGDREKLEIVLYNLLSNALKYTPKGGSVALSVFPAEETVEVRVADTGYGIPKAVGDKLFERFYQVREQGIPTKSGFGIGLYLARHFVESHKGNLTYDSEPGRGTAFSIRLLKGTDHFAGEPIFEEAAEEPALVKELLEDRSLVKKEKAPREGKTELESLVNENQSLLVVDDDDQIRQYIIQIFGPAFTIYEASNAEEGLKLAGQYVPDIIISDVNMQGMSGIDLCRSIKEDASLSHIPVILLTGSSSAETRLEGVEGGADDYITKPFERELLVARVANILKSRTTLQKYFFNEVTLQKNPLKISAEYKEFLDACIAIVEEHLDDPNFSIKMLATEIGMSHSNLYKKVKSISGQSVNAFIRFIRLRKAAGLLINTNSNVNETAAQVGFNDTKYFREQFSKLFGMNPSEYIKKYRKLFGKSFNLNEEGYRADS
ncbi:two-component regulator propeller domain-containing protein [Paraflavisolibacter sp. H34]|uniref:two-component regulator propeller domain-containing protein n=1 Tax=Huijunlia imazamoxiresistens TaxID=3127457 RepID=UPI0030169445